jgi:glycerol-3-phosphate dehydrogenase
MNATSFTDRETLWHDMQSGVAGPWDIIVVGGGITGAGILREAVRKGYKTLLLEQRDFAWGSSSRSSKMVHGGLRYLAAGNISLTRHALQERESLVTQAPGLVERFSYYFPLYRNRFPPRFAAAILFWLYDRLAGIRDHRRVDNKQLQKLFPQLDTSRNYSKVTGLLEDGDRVHGLTVEDVETGRQLSLQSRVVINATGAWAERLGKASKAGLTLRPQRGSHLMLSAQKFPVSHAVFLLHPADGRRLFIYPWEGRTVIGTTDIYHPRDLDTAASITAEELDYLLAAARQLFPHQPPARDDVISTWSGVRPIIISGRSRNLSKASRAHKIWSREGMVSCSGGKLTTFHHMALDVLSKAEEFLPPARQLSDDRIFADPELDGKDIMSEDPERGDRLLGRYGADASLLLDSAQDGERRTIPGTMTCLAQVRWALRHESVVHLDDLMLRRTRLGLLLENGGEAVLDDVRRLSTDVLGWSREKWQLELDRYRDIILRHYTIPG